jgi:HPt (histidine-containing phosphotransfer) domain-containing protein
VVDRCIGPHALAATPTERDRLASAWRTIPGRDEPGEAPCDLEDLARNYDTDPEEIRALFELFLPRAAELVERMRAAARDGDRKALQRDAHALRGISGTVRATRLFGRLEPGDGDADYDLDALAVELSHVQGYVARELGVRVASPAGSDACAPR